MSDELPAALAAAEPHQDENTHATLETANEDDFKVPNGNKDDIEKQEEDATNVNSPPSPKIRKLNRRSSIAVARRMSRASAAVSGGGGGLPLVDQLALVPGKDEALPADRLRQIVNICVRTTCRTIEGEEQESGEREDEARSVSRSLIDGSLLDQDNLQAMASRLQAANLKGNPQDFITGNASACQLQEYTDKLEQESKQWKQFLIDRNRTMKIEMNNLREAKKGSIKVEDTQFYQLPTDQKIFLRQLPNIEDVVKSTQELEHSQTILDERMVFESTRLRGLIRAVEKELSATTRELASYGQQGQDIIDILNDKTEGTNVEQGLSAESA